MLLLPDVDIELPSDHSWLSQRYNKLMFRGREGIAKFFASHQCGAMCRSMRLSAVPFVAAIVVGVGVHGKSPRL